MAVDEVELTEEEKGLVREAVNALHDLPIEDYGPVLIILAAAHPQPVSWAIEQWMGVRDD